jgi:hypothetical protein
VPLPFIAWEQGKVTICLDGTYTKAPKEGIMNEILLLGIDGDLCSLTKTVLPCLFAVVLSIYSELRGRYMKKW